MKASFFVLTLLAFAACSSEQQTPVDDIVIPINAQTVSQGSLIYLRNCSLCHGKGGKGDGPASVAFNPKPRDHTNGEYMDTLSNVHIFNVVKNGGAVYGKPTMPAQPMLSDAEIKQVVAYVRSLSNTYKKK